MISRVDSFLVPLKRGNTHLRGLTLHLVITLEKPREAWTSDEVLDTSGLFRNTLEVD